MDSSSSQSILHAADSSIPDIPANVVNNVFSHANVFGVFLTLSLCLLTQPYGSLLYVKPAGIFGRTIFFFWRLNPFACAAEALLILYALLGMIPEVWNDRHRDAESRTSLRKRLHITATALLLLRGRTHLPEHWRALAQEETAQVTDSAPGSIHNQTAGAGALPANDSASSDTTRYSDASPALPSENAGEFNSTGSPVIHESNARNVIERPTPSSEGPLQPPGPVAPESPGSAISPNPTTSGYQQATSPDENVSQSRDEAETASHLGSRFVTTALGGNVLAHAEFVIDLVTIISVIIVILKFIAVTVPPYIHFTVWFMISGWASVQLLLALSHGSEVDSIPPAALFRRAFSLEKKLRHPVIWTLLSIPILPLFGYLSFAMCYRTIALPLVMKKIYTCICISFYCAPFCAPIYEDLVISIGSCLHRPRRLRTCLPELPRNSWFDCKTFSSKSILIFAPSFLLVEVGLFSLFLSIGECISCSSSQCTKGVCTPTFVYVVAMFSVVFFLPTILLKDPAKKRDLESFQTASVLWGLLMAVHIFTGAMMLYGPDGTYKPNWLDWLGRLDKTIRGV